MMHTSVDMNSIKNRLLAAAFCMVVLLPLSIFGQEGKSVGGSPVRPGAAPIAIVIQTITIDSSTNRITITGQNFGTTTPTVKLAGNQLVVDSFNAATQTIVAFLPGVLSPGTYTLTVSTGSSTNQTTESDVTIGVSSFNGRDGTVALTSADVIGALGYTPQQPLSTGFGISIAGNTITNAGSYTVTAGTGLKGGGTVQTGGSVTLENGGVLSLNGRNGEVALKLADITGVLGFTPQPKLSAGNGISIDGDTILNTGTYTINAGAGLSGGGTVQTGGSVKLDNKGVLSLNGRNGDVALTSADVEGALGFTPLTIPFIRVIDSPEAPLILVANTGPNAGIRSQGVRSGVEGVGIGGDGIEGIGVFGTGGLNGTGISGRGRIGVLGSSLVAPSLGGLAGRFDGNVVITGNLSAGSISKPAGSFKIDHPLDPENKYLYHSFVESPDMMNIYNGNEVLDANGEAVVVLPEWFETLNRDFRYQLSCIGGFAPVYIAKKVEKNSFKIAGGKPGMEISWQITGIRQDAYANAHRIPVEEDKSEKERGYYLYPDAYGQPEEKGINRAQNSEMIRRMKEQRK